MESAHLGVHILVLNFNGRDLLRECLPSVVAAAAQAGPACGVTVVDNDSTDGSREYLLDAWPEVGLVHSPNLGLASFNAVLERLAEPIVLLLNNDVRLDLGAIGPLVRALREHSDALFSAPLCWNTDGTLYEGMRTRVRWRFGLVQGMSRTPGHELVIREPDLTAAAGPVLAVDRDRFLALGGFDPLYFPGRIEDLDLGFRGWMAGYRGYYVPQSVAYHVGMGSFGPAFGAEGCRKLALRNTLLFVWKNLRGRRLWSHFGWLGVRSLRALATGETLFFKALAEALARHRQVRRSGEARVGARLLGIAGQEAFFERFRW